MEWVLEEYDFADPYVDDIIVGSTGADWDEVLVNHERDLREVLDRCEKEKLVINGSKAHMFCTSVEFCGHVLTQGTRSPAPKKLLSIQKWDLPRTVTALRGFLGLTNHYSSYVQNYSGLAAPLTAKLQLSREDGKRDPKKP